MAPGRKSGCALLSAGPHCSHLNRMSSTIHGGDDEWSGLAAHRDLKNVTQGIGVQVFIFGGGLKRIEGLVRETQALLLE